MHIKLNKHKKLVIISICAVFSIILLSSILTVSVQKKPSIAFYNIPEQTVSGLQELLGDSFSYVTLNSSRPLAWELEKRAKPAMVITPSGKALQDAKKAVSKKVQLGTGILKDATSSIRELSIADKSKEIKALPVLSSHLEIAVQTQELKKAGKKIINSWYDLEQFAIAANEKSGTKIAFAGKDSALLLDILGAMTEAISGKQSYENAVQLIEIAEDKNHNNKAEFNGEETAKALAGSPDTPLYEAVRMLNRWYKEGILFPETFSLEQKTVQALMENKSTCAVIMTLDAHRQAAHTTISRYSSIYFPSNIPAYSRAFTAPVYFAVPLKNNRQVIKAALQLISVQSQEALSRTTGLAPVLARCRTPDKQSDDARYWVAATNSPLAGLSRDISLSESQQAALADSFAAMIRFGTF
ncbi:MAG: hypothetical protein K6G80_02920 [Treponema sp.]|nr:hypothetical protein [Treponema sp.]